MMPPQNTLEILNAFLGLTAFVLGGMVGSFLNVCVYRIPRNESIVHPRSHCPKCGTLIAWYDNIPLLSWLMLGAKCRQCREPISWQYPLVEGITALLFFAVFRRFGITVAAPIYMAFAASMVLVTFVDLTDWTIPDEVTIPGVFIGLGCSVLGMLYPASALVMTDIVHALIGAALGGAIPYLLDKVAILLLKKRGFGFGDVKLLAMLGAFTGWQGVLVIMALASFLGSIIGILVILWRKRKGVEEQAHYIPFGPYLAVAGLIYIFFGASIIETYIAFLHIPEPEPAFLLE